MISYTSCVSLPKSLKCSKIFGCKCVATSGKLYAWYNVMCCSQNAKNAKSNLEIICSLWVYGIYKIQMNFMFILTYDFQDIFHIYESYKSLYQLM
jgi:hypothetical protein